MSGQYRWTDEGLYVCIRCGDGLEPGHSLNCDGPKLKRKSKTKTDNKVEDENYSKQLDDGFALLDRD